MSYESPDQPPVDDHPPVYSPEKGLTERCQEKHNTISPKTPCAPIGSMVNIPELRPSLEIRWGDGPHDQIETDDLETLCIVASNPHTNVTIKDLIVTVAVVINEDGGEVPKLPDGTPSILVTPSEMIGFGDLPPHNPNQQNQNQQSGASQREAREIVLVSRGARGGSYKLKLEYTYSVEIELDSHDEFAMTLIPS